MLASSSEPFKHLSTPPSQITFEELGVREPLVAALHVAYPNVRFPTVSQTEFIPAILSGRDVLLKDATGTGKSFGVTLALLNKPRIGKPDRAAFDAGEKPPVNSLVIVPHRDLALQLYHWVRQISSQLGKSPLTSISSLAHVLIRGGGVTTEDHIATLRADPPHMVIGTPQALIDVLKRDASALRLETLSTVVVDEVDYLIEGTPRKTSEWNARKLARKERAHPNQTGMILDQVFAAHAPKPRDLGRENDGEEEEKRWKQRTAKERRATRPPPQLVMASATLRTRLKLELLAKEGWLTRGTEGMAQVTGKMVHKKSSQFAVGNLGGQGILHHILVVSPDGQTRNIPGAVEPVITEGYGNEPDFTEQVHSLPNEPNEPEPLEPVRGPKKPLPFSPTLLETVATSFALDVPRGALLVVPANSPVSAIVQELRELGVNAHGLDLLAEDSGRSHLMRGPSDVAVATPTLLVSTLASTRGLDLPELSHVFILGLPDIRRVDPYLHAAGRVGRFGRGGKVVTVLAEPPMLPGGKPARGIDEVKRMGNILREAGVTPTKFEHFD